MPFMQSLECCRLLVQLIVLAFYLTNDRRYNLLLSLKRHKLVSKICKL